MDEVRQLHQSLRKRLDQENIQFAIDFWTNRNRRDRPSNYLSGAQKDMKKAHGGVVEFNAALSRAYSDLIITKEEWDAGLGKYLREYEAAGAYDHATCVLQNGACVGHVFSHIESKRTEQ